jgi:hypothetical protein
LIAAQRAAGEASFAALKEQLKLSALLPALPAANAALVALMQDNKSAAAAISIINLMASPPVCEGRPSCERTGIRPPGSCDPSTFAFNYITKSSRTAAVKSARSLHKIIPVQCRNIAASGFGRAARRVSSVSL